MGIQSATEKEKKQTHNYLEKILRIKYTGTPFPPRMQAFVTTMT